MSLRSSLVPPRRQTRQQTPTTEATVTAVAGELIDSTPSAAAEAPSATAPSVLPNTGGLAAPGRSRPAAGWWLAAQTAFAQYGFPVILCQFGRRPTTCRSSVVSRRSSQPVTGCMPTYTRNLYDLRRADRLQPQSQFAQALSHANLVREERGDGSGHLRCCEGNQARNGRANSMSLSSGMKPTPVSCSETSHRRAATVVSRAWIGILANAG